MGGYLVCDECKGYYQLKDGENPFDFELKCHCGGKLKYAKNINKLVQIREETPQKIIIKDDKDNDYRKSKNKSIHDEGPFLFNLKWLLLFTLYIIFIIGFFSQSEYYLYLGVLSFILLLLLGYFYSWLIYLLIFSLWTFGGYFGLFSGNPLSLFFGLTVVILGALNLGSLLTKRIKREKI